MQFSPELRDRVADGTITLSYRLWSRPKVKVGGVYRSGSVMIEVDDIELLPFSTLTDDDLARPGEPDVETLRRRAAHAGPIHDDTLVYRGDFHVVRHPGTTSGCPRSRRSASCRLEQLHYIPRRVLEQDLLPARPRHDVVAERRAVVA